MGHNVEANRPKSTGLVAVRFGTSRGWVGSVGCIFALRKPPSFLVNSPAANVFHVTGVAVLALLATLRALELMALKLVIGPRPHLGPRPQAEPKPFPFDEWMRMTDLSMVTLGAFLWGTCPFSCEVQL